MKEVPYHKEYTVGNRSDRSTRNELFEDFQDYIESRGRSNRGGMRNRIGYRNYDNYDTYDTYNTYGNNHEGSDYENRRLMRMMGYNRKHNTNHFDEREAYEAVEGMYHVKDDKKYIGEKFPMDKAREVRKHLTDPEDYTIADIYVAINAQYHDYCELFEKWFGSDIDNKVIASAIEFWFEDDDFEGNKIWEYINLM